MIKTYEESRPEKAEVMILEVSERDGFEGYDYEILKELWKEWLTNMGHKNCEEDFFTK